MPKQPARRAAKSSATKTTAKPTRRGGTAKTKQPAATRKAATKTTPKARRPAGKPKAKTTASTTRAAAKKRRSPISVAEYIAGFPADVQTVLESLRSLIKKAAPGVTERISYGIPTFDLDGHYLVYFAAWKQHIGMYPMSAGVRRALAAELAGYQGGKGTVQFPLDRPLPLELIRRIVEWRVQEIG